MDRKGGGLDLKKIVISIQNSLLAEAIATALKKQGQFKPERIAPGDSEEIVPVCCALRADILLMETTHLVQSTLESRLRICDTLQKRLQECKLVLICDENADAELADRVKQAKQAGRIDAFFYASVTSSYLAAALDAL